MEPMSPTEKILQILNEHPETLSEWGYEEPVEINDGLEFSINTCAYHPGWVRVFFDEADGAYFIKTVDEEHGRGQEVCSVPETELFDILDRVIRVGLTEEVIVEIRKRWLSMH